MPRARIGSKLSETRRKEIGARIREARAPLNLSQEELGKKVGVSARSVSNWEKGVYPPYGHLDELAAALEVTPAWLDLGDQRAETEAPGVDNGVSKDHLLTEIRDNQILLLDELRKITRLIQITGLEVVGSR